LEVAVRGELNANGIVVDFDDLGAVVQEGVLEELDHSFLNDILENPTAEEIAFLALERLMAQGLQVEYLRLWESSECFAEVRP
jgi:6-pyruvoyltetrahydropterin/6-carboxytetrahydropterin synthase